jgi:hypothetical protein
MLSNLLGLKAKTPNQWDAEKSEKADQSGYENVFFCFGLIRRYQIFPPFPRSIKDFLSFLVPTCPS